MPLAWMWKRRLWIACGFGFVALVTYMSLAPDPWRAPTVDEFKTGHIFAYFWLMMWFGQLWDSVPRRIVIALLLCLLGVGLEFAQAMTGYRTFAYSDMADNALGTTIGLVLCLTPLGRMRPLLERRRVPR